MQRRSFLRNTAVAATALSLTDLPLHAQGPPVGCALYGLGHAHAPDVLKVLQSHPDYRLVGVCEPDASVEKPFRENPAFSEVVWLEEKKLLEDPEIRVVAVESDVPRLLDLAEKAVGAGKHVHLDKPAGSSLPHFERILKTAEEKHLLLQMGYMFRYNPGFDRIRQAVREGALGEVFSIQASLCTDLGPDKRRQFALHPGGVLFELGCHLIDMIVLLMGAPQKVSSVLHQDGGKGDGLVDNAWAILEYDRAIVTVEVNAMERDAFPARRFKVVGTAGSMILSPLEPPRLRTALRSARGSFGAGVGEESLPDLDRHRADFADLARCLRGESDLAYSKAHDLLVQKVLLEACGG